MNGVGGRTIAEARERLSFAEFKTWVAFRRKRGSLHPGMRMEHGFALLASQFHNAHRKQNTPPVKLTEFMPHMEEQAVSLEQAMEQWH